MTQARKQRLKEARGWFFQQHFMEKSHVVKAYRVRFGVDRECAMRELCMLKLLSPEKQEMYEKQLAEKERKLPLYCRKYIRRCSLWHHMGGRGRN